MKIAIIGYSGSGKSTLAKKLSEIYNCPLLYLDTIQFEANWKIRDIDEGRLIVGEFLKNDSWIIDGNYREFLQEKRLQDADKIIFMNFPRRICFPQAFKRYLHYKNKTRESMADGCNEKFDLEFIKWLLFEGRKKSIKNHYNEICKCYKDKITIFRNNKDVENFLASL
ncbi:DNA topology modulation protein [uncultured Clostridium sp.]|uniref:DNA topology modulation protein n=1 Tax=uncultured Clostridium sp. TaxID=59620 RepID=UPI0026712469|nr:DNA topology modulation protein [uncultured Clostridium sp.]